MFDVSGKVVLITGGCGGIGLAYAKALLKSNIKGIVLVDIDITNGKDVDIREYKEKVLLHKANVTVKDQLKNAFDKTIETFNQLDIVINNAGIFHELNPELTIAVNLVAVLNVLNLAKDEYLLKYRSGTEGLILNTASVMGLFPNTAIPTYSATKAAVISLGRSIGSPENYASTKIKIITICPGLTLTPMTDPANFSKNLSPAQIKALLLVPSPPQSCEQLIDCVLRVIQRAETGSVWTVVSGVEKIKNLEPLFGKHI